MKKCIFVLFFALFSLNASGVSAVSLKLGRLEEQGQTFSDKSRLKFASGGDIKELPPSCPEPPSCPTEEEMCKSYPTPESCRSNSDCPSNSIAKYCNSATHVCVQCISDSQCSGEEVCENGVCKATACKTPESCKSDSDCPSNSTAPHCDSAAKRCVQCVTSSHCSAGETCESGVCKAPAYTDFENVSCPSEYPEKQEVNGIVSCTCNATSCSSGKKCVNGSCQIDGVCTKHSDCPNNMLCRMLSGEIGKDTFIGKCSPPSEFCGGNVKVAREGDQKVSCGACATYADCPAGTYCYQGTSEVTRRCPTAAASYCDCASYQGIEWSYEPQATRAKTKGYCVDICAVPYSDIPFCGYPYCQITGDHTFNILQKE